MSLSRRLFLGGLLAAPAVIYIGHLMPLRGEKLLFQRTRETWKIVLEPDGSTTLKNGTKKWLNEWIKYEDPKNWGKTGFSDYVWADGSVTRQVYKPSLKDMRNIIDADAKALEHRCSHWSDFTTFQREKGVKVEATLYDPGTVFEGDIIPPLHKVADWPVFQFAERPKDWIGVS